jgi:hypothetical protein
MKLLSSKKAIISILGVSSVVLASTMRDMKSHTVLTEKLDDDKEMVPLERNVASAEAPSKVAQLYLPVNEVNIKKVNATWDIARIIGSDEKVMFDKFQSQEDSKKSIKVRLELVGNGIVRIDGDNAQIYRVSILTDFGTIALFKKVDNGYEIIEAKKISAKTLANNDLTTSDEERDLVLERALNQTHGNKILTGADVSGQLTLKNNTITNLAVNLHNENGQDQSIEIDMAEIKDGGAFKAEVEGEEVSGVLFNNGKDGYRLSFVTGPMSGAMLNFVSKEQMENIQEKEEAQSRDQLDQGSQTEQASEQATEQEVKPEVKATQQQAVEERKVEAQNVPEGTEPMTVEEVKQTAAAQGFAF